MVDRTIHVACPGDGEKLCAECAVIKPASGFYFHKDSTAADGWCPVCKECRKKKRQEERNRKINSQLSRLGVNLLDNLQTADCRKIMPDIVSGAEVVLQAFGGIEGLAQKLAEDYEGSQVGTAGRTKILLGVVGFVAKAMEQQQPVNLTDMDDDQLRLELEKALGNGVRRIADQP